MSEGSVERDTQEWRRPWRDGDDRDAVDPARRAAQPSVATAPDHASDHTSDHAPGDVDRPTAASSGAEPSVDADADVTAAQAAAVRDVQPTAATTPAAVSRADALQVPLAAPAPPPGGWSDHDEGPGSPRGSVRPPDTTGTVETPPVGGGRRRLVAPLLAALLGSAIGTGATLAIVDGDAGQVRAGVGAEQDPVRAPLLQDGVAGADGAEVGSGEGTVVSNVARAVLPSVARIEVYTEGPDGQRQRLGLGSGVVYRSDGFLLTNNHVVDGADAIEVQFADGRITEAELVGGDRLTDLAVLKVDAEGLPAINLRETPLQVGETAVAIGSPFGLDASVTAGIVSALNRNLDVPGDGDDGAFVIPAVIQTDAAINPGNSGGALVDAQGRLIGINTAILTRSGGSQGVGFAIPVNSATSAADQLITVGFVSHPFLGISGYDVTIEVAERYREDFGIDLEGGAVIDSVVPGSGAAVAGIEAEDVVVAVGGEPVGSMGDVIVAVRAFAPDDEVTVEVLRQDERLELEVTLGERPR